MATTGMQPLNSGRRWKNWKTADHPEYWFLYCQPISNSGHSRKFLQIREGSYTGRLVVVFLGHGTGDYCSADFMGHPFAVALQSDNKECYV
jgi:hypothetical protein